MNKIGVHFGYWYRGGKPDFFAILEKVKAAEADVMELDPRMLMELPESEYTRLKKRAEDLGILFSYCGGLPLDADMASEDPISRKKGVDAAKETIDFIRNMGGTNYSGVLYSIWPLQPTGTLDDKSAYIARSVKCMKDVAAYAQKKEILYSLEIVNRFEQFMLNTTEEGLEFLDQVGNANCKLLLDVFHMNIEEDDIVASIIKANDNLGHFHIGECNRKIPGTGRMQWDNIFKALKQINYTGYITLEPFVKMGGELARSVCVWRDLSNDADDAQMAADIKNGVNFVKAKLAEIM